MSKRVLLYQPENPCHQIAVDFIHKHQLDAGKVMQKTPRTAICNLLNNLSGVPAGGLDILTEMLSHGTLIWPFTPSGDGDISFEGCNIELFSATAKGTFHNYLPANLQDNGLIGGAGMSFGTGWMPSDGLQNNASHLAYVTTDGNITHTQAIFGCETSSSNRSYFIQLTGSPDVGYAINSAASYHFAGVAKSGLVGVHRFNSSQNRYSVSGSFLEVENKPSTTPPGVELHFGARNNNGTIDLEADEVRFATIIVNAPPFSTAEWEWLDTCITTYNAEVITNGRDV